MVQNPLTSTNHEYDHYKHHVVPEGNVTSISPPEALLLDVAQDVPQLESLVANVNHLATEGAQLGIADTVFWKADCKQIASNTVNHCMFCHGVANMHQNTWQITVSCSFRL